MLVSNEYDSIDFILFDFKLRTCNLDNPLNEFLLIESILLFSKLKLFKIYLFFKYD